MIFSSSLNRDLDVTREADVSQRKAARDSRATWVVPRESSSRPICGREVFVCKEQGKDE